MSPAPAPLVRPAAPTDADALARCQLDCWRDAYSGMVDPARLAAALADVEGRARVWRRILTAFPDRLVAEHEGGLVGFAAAGPQRDPDLDVATELYSLYVRRVWWGTGLGHRLLTAVLGDADASLWVLRDNDRARRAYGRHGFVLDDRPEQLDDHFGGVEVRMVRRNWAAPGD